MKELLALFAQIAVSRKGPQDLPASYLLLVLTVAGYFVIYFLVSSVMPTAHWQSHLVIEIAFKLAWYAALLKTVGKPERFVQTTTAIFGYELVLTPLFVITAYLAQQVKPEDWVYLPIGLMALALAIWVIRAGSYVLKAALEIPVAACVVLMILHIFAGELLKGALTLSSTSATT